MAKSNMVLVASVALSLGLGGVAVFLWFRLAEAERVAAINAADLNRRLEESQLRQMDYEKKLKSPAPAKAAADAGAAPAMRRNVSEAQAVALRRSPKFLALRAAEEAQRLEAQYSPLFKRLKLPPEQYEKMKKLLVDIRLVPLEVTNGKDALGGAEISAENELKLIKEIQAKMAEEIHQVVGDQAYDQYRTYVATLTERLELDAFTRSLRDSSEPLTEEQSDQLIGALSSIKAAVRAENKGYMPSNESPEKIHARYLASLDQAKSSMTETQLQELKKAFDRDFQVRKAREALTVR